MVETGKEKVADLFSTANDLITKQAEGLEGAELYDFGERLKQVGYRFMEASEPQPANNDDGAV